MSRASPAPCRGLACPEASSVRLLGCWASLAPGHQGSVVGSCPSRLDLRWRIHRNRGTTISALTDRTNSCEPLQHNPDSPAGRIDALGLQGCSSRNSMRASGQQAGVGRGAGNRLEAE